MYEHTTTIIQSIRGSTIECADMNLVLLRAVTFLLFLHSSSVFQTSETFLLGEVSDSLLPPSVASYIQMHTSSSLV